jgi:predicted DNA repair protein MutK
MASGLFALLDDVAAIAKVAAASLDDVAAQTVKAGSKAAGIVIDDTAVTPRYVVGFAAERELGIIWRIALGSLRNKLLLLLPGALALQAFLPWAITPLLMLGGLYLCFEGAEKLIHWIVPHGHDHDVAHAEAEQAAALGPADAAAAAKALEEEKVAGAIRTDLILSAEIMAISLATIEADTFWLRAFILAVVGIAITVGVYGLVALIVKADDVGAALARGRVGIARAVGRGLVAGMPVVLAVLSVVGTIAMLWVGGGIILHGLAEFGVHGPEDVVHHAAEAVGHAVAPLAGLLGWLVTAGASAVVGLLLGGVIVAALLATRRARA